MQIICEVFELRRCHRRRWRPVLWHLRLAVCAHLRTVHRTAESHHTLQYKMPSMNRPKVYWLHSDPPVRVSPRYTDHHRERGDVRPTSHQQPLYLGGSGWHTCCFESDEACSAGTTHLIASTAGEAHAGSGTGFALLLHSSACTRIVALETKRLHATQSFLLVLVYVPMATIITR